MYKFYYDESDWSNSANTNRYEDEGSIVRQQPHVKMNSIRLAVLGDYGVGKTALIRRFCHDEFETAHETTTKLDLYSTTISVTSNKNDRKVKVELYDTPGMDQYKENVGNFYHSCHAAILVYDTTEQYSFQNIPDRIASVRRSLPPYAELFMIGTKCDCSGEHRKVKFKEADIFATKNNLSLFETSAKSGSGLSDAFARIAESVLQRYEIGTFDPSSWIVPAASSNKGQPTGDNDNGLTVDKSRITHGQVTLNWPFMCCWF